MNRSLPKWVVPVSIAVTCLAALALGARFVNQTSDAPGKPMAVHPGMYNFRADLAKHASQNAEANAQSTHRP